MSKHCPTKKRTNRYGRCCQRRPAASSERERQGREVDVVRSYLSALSRGDIDAVFDLVEPGGRQVDLGDSGACPDAAKRRARLESLRHAYEEIEFRMVDSWQTEGRIAFRWKAQGTTLCGDVVELRGLDMFELSEEGRVKRHWLDLRPERYFPELEDCPEFEFQGRGWGGARRGLGSRTASETNRRRVC